MATRDGVSTGSPEASYQRLEICAVSSTTYGGPWLNETRESTASEAIWIENFRVG